AEDASRVASLLSGDGRLPSYAALHVHPKFNYKMWHADGWVGLSQWLAGQGMTTVLTGGPEPGEMEFTTAVAMYGPSNPVKWGPWPRDFTGASSPWRRVGVQACGNVLLVQGAGACVPCMREGCDQHVASYSDCLRQMPLS